MLVAGKKFLVTGVLTEDSIAFSTARLLQEQGGEVVLTSFGRALRVTERVAGRLPARPDVLELDVTQPGHLARLLPQLRDRWEQLDGVLHAIAFAPEACLAEDMLAAQWADVAAALHVSAFSLKSIAGAVAPLMAGGGSIVALDFDASQAWPGYNWMGVSKAALESLARYLARDLGPHGIRVNLVSAGPLSTVAARAIPLYRDYERVWKARAPLGWDTTDTEAVGRACVALLSDWFPATTGEIVHVDGGTHAVGAAPGAGLLGPAGTPRRRQALEFLTRETGCQQQVTVRAGQRPTAYPPTITRDGGASPLPAWACRRRLAATSRPSTTR